VHAGITVSARPRTPGGCRRIRSGAEDLTATREYRRHLGRILTRRALTTARG